MSEPEDDDFVAVIEKTLRRLVIATVVLYLAIIGTCYYVYTVAQGNTEGLCALRNDAQSRITQTELFLKENPKGIPGVSSQQLKRSTDSSKRTVKALSSVRCPPPPAIAPDVEKTATWLGL